MKDDSRVRSAGLHESRYTEAGAGRKLSGVWKPSVEEADGELGIGEALPFFFNKTTDGLRAWARSVGGRDRTAARASPRSTGTVFTLRGPMLRRLHRLQPISAAFFERPLPEPRAAHSR